MNNYKSVISILEQTIRNVPDFPKPGIMFKDITPVIGNPKLVKDTISCILNDIDKLKIDAVAGIESRGFLFGMLLSDALSVPFIPLRKKGKLPYHTVSYKYELEYGSAEIEMHIDAVKPEMNVLIHDDLLATGGTAYAASKLIEQTGGNVSAYSFIIELSFLEGRQILEKEFSKVYSLLKY